MDERSFAETRAWLTLLRAPDIGPATLRALVRRAGSAAAALDGFERLRGEFRFGTATLAWLRQPDGARIDADLAWLDGAGHHLLGFDDPAFPGLLQEIGAAPAALFVAGDPALLWRPQVAVVGARAKTRRR